MHTKRLLLAALALGVAVLACRTGGPQGPQAPAAPAPGFVQSLAGQRRILLHQGDAGNLQLRKDDAGQAKGECDIAVEVNRASLEKGTLHLVLEFLGRPEVGEKPGARCGDVIHVRTVAVAGFAAGDGASVVTPVVDRFLPSPESYLAARGVTFVLAADPKDPVLAARTGSEGTAEERTLGRQVTSWPKRVLAVQPAFYDLSRRVHQESELEFTAVVGADGRIHQPRLLTGGLGESHEALVFRALTLWRYEPARKGSEPVAARVDGRLRLRIY